MPNELLCSNEKYQKYIKILTNEKLPKTEVESKQMSVCLEELECIISHLENFISAFPSSYSKSRIILSLSEVVILFGLVDKFKGEERDFSAEDFPYTAAQASKAFQCLKILIKEFIYLESSHRHHFIINVLLLCATHNTKYFWSDENSVNLSREILNDILECTKHETLFALLCDESFYPTIFKRVLKKMRPSLMKDTWMLNPSSCYMFYWFLSNVKHPHLVDYLSDVFPPLFMFVSYYGVPQQVLGIQCIDHLLDNVPPTLMKLDGKEDALYHIIYPYIHLKTLDIVTVLYPCILKLPMMQTRKGNLVCWSEYDKVFHQLLFMTETENNLKLRRMCLAHVLSFTEHIPPFKHLKHLMNVLKIVLIEYITRDKECQTAALKILRAVIKSCWPRMEYHCFEILTFICGLFDSEDPPVPNEEIYNLCEDCIILLKRSCAEKFQALTANYITEGSDMPGVDLLKSALAKDS